MTPKDFVESSTFIWHQRFLLGEGVYTPGRSDVEWLLARADVPEDLSGRSVLDVGTANGGVAFEAERRGAGRVVAVDIYPAEWFGFDKTRRFLGSRAEFVQASVYGLSELLAGEQFDFVFFWGVLYHLRHPLLALDELRRLTKYVASIETQIGVDLPSGAVRFYPHDELAGDSSNWFAPAVDTLVAWCASCGFEPHVLATWPKRAPARCLVKALVVPGEPEYIALSYERPVCVLPTPPAPELRHRFGSRDNGR